MKFTNNKKIALATVATTMMSTVVNATMVESQAVARSLSEWVSIVAEVLSVLCLVVFSIYMGRYLSIKSNKSGEEDVKVTHAVSSCMMTSLIGMAICQAAIIVVQLF